jgi:hypothetical protein
LLSFEKNEAVLETSDKKEIKWPKDKLPDNLKLGDKFYLFAENDIGFSEGKREMARLILEEILNGEEK